MNSFKQIQTILKYVFVLVPIVAGLDKFMNILTTWTDYLNPMLLHIVPISAATFMMIVGVIEILAGILVYLRTEIGAYVVSIWLVLIALSLIFSGKYFDVAVRDLIIAISAFILARTTHILSKL
jgi:hypothetical protein